MAKSSQKQKEYRRARYRECQLKVFKAYSKSEVPHCAKCNFNDVRALTIDHMNDDGADHREAIRKELGRVSKIGAEAQYYWLVDNNFPQGFQVLCHNCQHIKKYGDNNYYAGSANKRYQETDVSKSQI
jgi:hypothetical protein